MEGWFGSLGCPLATYSAMRFYGVVFERADVPRTFVQQAHNTVT